MTNPNTLQTASELRQLQWEVVGYHDVKSGKGNYGQQAATNGTRNMHHAYADAIRSLITHANDLEEQLKNSRSDEVDMSIERDSLRKLHQSNLNECYQVARERGHICEYKTRLEAVMQRSKRAIQDIDNE